MIRSQKTRRKKLTSTVLKDRKELSIIEPAQEECTVLVPCHVDKEQQEREARIQKQKEEEKANSSKLLGATDPQDWILYVEHTRQKGNFLKHMNNLLYLPSCSSKVICLGTFSEANVRKLCILGKTSLITRLAIDALENSTYRGRIQADERRYLDMTGISETEIRDIETIIQSGLQQFRSLILPADHKMLIMAP